LTEGLSTAGRARQHFEIAGGGFVATGPDDAAVARMVEWVRGRVAFYGSTPAYWPVLAAHGLDELGRKLNAMTKENRWGEMAALVSDDVVHLFAAVGRHDRLVAAIQARFGGLVDTVAITPEAAGTLPPGLMQDIQRLPRAFEGYASA
jgi:hypothetical protein